MLRRHGSSLAFAGFAVGAAATLGVWGWPVPHQAVTFAGLIAAATLVSAFAVRPSVADDWTIVAPSLVIQLTTLLLLGRDAAIGVAAAAAIATVLAAARPRRLPHALGRVIAAVTATASAGFLYDACGGTPGRFSWPFEAVPIAIAAAAYCLVICLLADLVAPLLAKQPANRLWAKRLAVGLPNHIIAASLAAAAAEAIDHRLWQIVPAAALPLLLAYRAYGAHLERLDEQHRRDEISDALDHGMLVVDADGRVTLWSDSLERMFACPRATAIGRSITDAVPALTRTLIPRAIQDAEKTRTGRLFPAVAIDPRVFEVRVLPVADGVTLLFQDVTQRAQHEQAIRRSEERLSLAADGANDGLWEWDRRTQEMYFSRRWKTMVGLPPEAGTGRVDDWINRVHPDDVASLKLALDAHTAGGAEHFVHEHRLRHEDGTYRRVLCRGVSVRAAGNRLVRIGGSLTDTTERAITQEQLRTAGVLDPLTGLSNRAEFVEVLRRRLDALKQHPSANKFAALYLDLDRFKIVNDSLGHLVGDELLKAVSRRLESCLREGDALARLGGDEFAILLNGLSEEEQANAIAFRIQKALSTPFAIGGREVFTSASIGIAFGRPSYNSPDEIMRDADSAMYHAKASGKARHELFDADMHARTLDRIGLESDLRHAVENNDFQLHYQPIVLLGSGMCVGFESLIRWSRNGEPISPATFIPMAEELGLIEPVGTWCLEQACSTFAEWKRRYPHSSLEYITVNVSSRQLVQQNFLSLVERVVHEAGLRPSDLRLEITETALMDSPTAAAGLLRELREFGVKIYLDDFGTGYSSLSHLHRLPVDALKIDRSFVKSLGLPDRPLIVESILALARTMNTSVVAEGIETDVQAQELERLGCTHAQGFLFSRPIPAAAAENVVAANQPLSPHKARSVRAFEPKVAIPA